MSEKDFELILPADLNDQWAEIYLTVKDYVFYGASYQITLTLLQEIGLTYNNAVSLLAQIDIETTLNE